MTTLHIIIIVFFSFFFFTKVYCQSNTKEDILFWTKERRLNFSDFKGSPSKEDTAVQVLSPALSNHRLGTLSKSIDVQISTKPFKTTFTIYAGMQRNRSWIKNFGDSTTLMHEQVHFDICEIYARMLRRDIRKAKSLSQAKDLWENITEKEEMEHDAFDKENSSATKGPTPKWLALIKKRLKELELYSHPVVTVPIGK